MLLAHDDPDRARQPRRRRARWRSDAGVARSMVEADRRNSETVVAMGMADALASRWAAVNSALSRARSGAPATSSAPTAASPRCVRLLLQSAILGLGAYLVIRRR